ncbi:MAG: site-specific integrase, partial [Nitrospirales bacterium]
KLGPVYGPWARLAILTGMRLGEQFGLKWPWVDFDQRFITLPHTKAGEAQYVYLNAEAQGILRTLQIQQMNGGVYGPWIFPSENPASHLDQRNFYARIFVPAVEEAKLEGVTWHTLRHTFASRLAMAGYSEGTIAALLRHSTTALVRRYAHLSQDHLKGAVEDVAGFGKPAQKYKTGTPTVTKTVKEELRERTKETEVVENVGAGEGI